MINGLQGIPGSGKSYESVAFHVLMALKQGRKVITNLPLILEQFGAINPDWLDLIELRWKAQPVRGTWDAERINENTGEGDAFELFEDRHTEQPPEGTRRFGHVWDFYTEWKHPKTGRGPLFIIDECHVPFPKLGTNKQVVEWFKLHRHFNVDVLLMTQNFRDMDQEIAGLIAILVKCRKADVLGKPDHYIRNVHSGYRGALISSEERKYKPEYFGLYKSHTQGNSVGEAEATDVKPFMVKFNRFKWGWIAFSVVVTIWAFWPAGDKKKPKPLPAKMAAADAPWQEKLPPDHPARINWELEKAGKLPKWDAEAEAAKYAAQHKDQLSDPSGQASDMQPVATGEMPEPFTSKGIHLTGRMTMKGRTVYTFAISHSAVYVNTVTSLELESMGYRWAPLTDCAGALAWRGKVRAVICDSPRATVITAAN
ncbi:zonular occludens toxin domain-containing protein [Variovorax sp. VNK109]|uniref:zonular occludens toxin domain-containing protein n=1 Tax=Variovorax sp. VNK109 TaxID=3400919 RepID=UPI003C09836A